MTARARWWFLGDLHLDPRDPGSTGTAGLFRRFVDDVLLARPSTDDHLVLLGDTFELRRARDAATRSPEDALRAALRAFPDARAALRRALGGGLRVQLACGNHDYPLMSPGCREVLAEELGESLTPASVHPWLLLEPGAFYAEHGHQHHDLNRLPHQLLASSAAPGERLEPTILESWDLSRTAGAGAIVKTRALVASMRSTKRAERRAASTQYGRLLVEAGPALGPATLRALQDVSRFAPLRAGTRTARRVAARRLGRADHDGYLRAAAARIDQILGDSESARPLCYVFGHTHVAALDALPRRGAWYANTGTWSDHVHHGHRRSGGLPLLMVERGAADGAPVVAQLQYWDPGTGGTVVARTVEGGAR